MTAYEIPLTAYANQRFNFTVGTNIVEIVIRAIQGQAGIYCDVTIDTVPILQGFKPKAGVNFLKNVAHKLQGMELAGLFFIANNDKTEMSWEDLGTTVRLYYAVRS